MSQASQAYPEDTRYSVTMSGFYLDVQIIGAIRQLITSHDYQLSKYELKRIKEYSDIIIDELIDQKRKEKEG
jgi:hypothetical protein